jgi:hypothetical protein
MPFGKYQGDEVHELPRRYLNWLDREVLLYGDLRKAVSEALSGRRYDPPPAVPVDDVIQGICVAWPEQGEHGI